MNIFKYFLISHMILATLTCTSLYTITLQKSKYKDLTNKVNVLLRLIIHISFIYFCYKYKTILFKYNDEYLLYLIAVLIITIGYVVLSIFYFYKNNNYYIGSLILFIFAMILFLIRIKFFNNNNSLHNIFYSYTDCLIYLIAFILLLIYGFNGNYNLLFIGVIIDIIGRFISIYICYQNFLDNESAK